MKFLKKQVYLPDDLGTYFQKLDVLKHDRQLVTWFFLKPELFKTHCTVFKFAKFLFIGIVAALILCILWVSIVIEWDWLYLFPNHFDTTIVTKCQQLDTFGAKWYALTTFYGSKLFAAFLQNIKVNMVSGICLGAFVWFFTRHSAKDSSTIAYFSFLMMLFIFAALVISFMPSYVASLCIGLLLKDDSIQQANPYLTLGIEAVMSLMIALIMFIFTSLATWIFSYPIQWEHFWISFLCIFMVYSSLWIYPLVFLKTLFQKNTFSKNPYLHCSCIPFPLLSVDNQLLNKAEEAPLQAILFVRFLWERRPKQRLFAFQILHQAISTQWQTIAKLESHSLDHKKLLYCKKDKDENYLPSRRWFDNVTKMRRYLVEFETQTALALQLEKLQECRLVIADLQDLHSRETFIGRELYFDVFEHWTNIIANSLHELQQKAELLQIVPFNPYARGKALSPNDRYAKTLFLDRKDLKEEMALKIATSTSMPTFLILGQRRTGKTSLLNFLPNLLGARFKVISISMLDLSGATLWDVWWEIWKDITQMFHLELDTSILSSGDWLKDWKIFEGLLSELTMEKECHLILAFDEYDVLHEILAQNEKRAHHLLNRMRDFSQRQNQVIFMFIGASNFSDLRHPQWSRYFVHAQTFRVEYLSKEATLSLMTHPAPDFQLKYGENVLETIWIQTQGHPHLLHAIGSDLVDYANAKGKNPIQMADLDYILKTKIVQKEEQPFSVFWDEFAENEATRVILKAIVKKRFVDRENPILRRLVAYGYVIETVQHKFEMRVPLFARWVREFGY
jgi:ATPase family associated with various cellular activities (AAA)